MRGLYSNPGFFHNDKRWQDNETVKCLTLEVKDKALFITKSTTPRASIELASPINVSLMFLECEPTSNEFHCLILAIQATALWLSLVHS